MGQHDAVVDSQVVGQVGPLWALVFEVGVPIWHIQEEAGVGVLGQEALE